MNAKGKGIRLEREVKQVLQSRRFFVIRQSASHFPDLIAISPDGKVYFIECKTNKYISKDERRRLKQLARYGIPAIATKQRSGRKKHIVFLNLDYTPLEFYSIPT